jgi:gluconolactonase
VATEKGYRVVMAVVDPWGELVELRRTAGAQIASSRVAVDKARTAAIFVRPSREMEEQVTAGRIGALALHGASCLTGVIPLVVDGEVVGAIGTSGETPDEGGVISIAAAAAEFSVVEVPALTYEGARFAAEAAGAEAARRGVSPVISAVDAGGALMFLVRPDLAQVASVEVTTDKARTAAIYRRPSKGLRGPGLRRAALGAASGARGAAPGRHPDLLRRARDRRDRRQRSHLCRRGQRPRNDRRWRRADGVRLQRRRAEGRCVMAAAETPQAVVSAARVPGPPDLLPGRPDAVVDLQADEGAALVSGQWRYSDARVEEIDFVELAGPGAPDPLGPGDVPNRTYDVVPHAQAIGFDDCGWERLAPADTMRRLSTGRVCFNWYRIEVTIPERAGSFDLTGSTVVFEVAIDDYADVWVNGQLPFALGLTGGHVVAGFSAPNRVLLTRDARPGDRFQIAVFGINGPISTSPANYIWMRTAILDFYAPERAAATEEVAVVVERADRRLDEIVSPDMRLERVAGGFDFTEGPVWSPDGALLFSSPNTNAIYRLDTEAGRVTVFRSKSGYAGVDVGRYFQPGSNGLTFSPDRLLTICQHGNRRVIRVNQHGDITVLADRYEGKRLNSPNDLVYRSDGRLYLTDPPFGLPEAFDDPAKELPFSGVFKARDGVLTLVTDELAGPNGLAFSPDERYLYVGN